MSDRVRPGYYAVPDMQLLDRLEFRGVLHSPRDSSHPSLVTAYASISELELGLLYVCPAIARNSLEYRMYTRGTLRKLILSRDELLKPLHTLQPTFITEDIDAMWMALTMIEEI